MSLSDGRVGRAARQSCGDKVLKKSLTQGRGGTFVGPAWGSRHVAPAVASSSPDMVRTLVPRFVFGEDESGEDYEKTSLMTLIGLLAPP